MANPTKEQTVRRALEALANHYDAATARFATLGGAGYELAVWTSLDVPREHCWLIERDQHKARQLIPRARPAHVYVGELRDFPRMFRSVAPNGTLDVFHWDLCETMEPNARELRAVFPVIAGSQSRCLLITAADQRSNRSLDEADLIDAWWMWLLGGAEAFRAFRRHLEGMHDAARQREWTEAEPVNAATRDLSVLLHLLLVLCDFRWEREAIAQDRAMGLAALDRTRAMVARHQPINVARSFAGGREPSVTFVPDELVHFVYYSRAHTAVRPGFRMRTMGMHLARLGDPIPIRGAAARIARAVTKTPLHMVVPGSTGRIKVITVRGPTPPEELTMQSKPPQAVDGTSGTPTAPPQAPTNEEPFERIVEKVAALTGQLAQRLSALRLSTETVVVLTRQATESLEKLREIEASVRITEDAARATERVCAFHASAGSDGFGGDARPPPAAARVTGGATAKRARRRKLTDAERIQLRLRLFRARKAGEAALAVEKAVIQAETGFDARGIAGLISTAEGRFGPSFARAALRSVTGEARKELAAEFESWGFGRTKQLLRLLRSGR